jgi:hypothetical protein
MKIKDKITNFQEVAIELEEHDILFKQEKMIKIKEAVNAIRAKGFVPVIRMPTPDTFDGARILPAYEDVKVEKTIQGVKKKMDMWTVQKKFEEGFYKNPKNLEPDGPNDTNVT